MIAFGIASILMLAGAMLFVLSPLLRRAHDAPSAESRDINVRVLQDHLAELDLDLRAGTIGIEQHAQATRELQRRALQDTVRDDSQTHGRREGRRYGLACVVAAMVALPSVFLYAMLGAPAILDTNAAVRNDGVGNHAVSAERIVALVEGLSARLRTNPDDGEGWAMLARSYGVLGRHQDALVAYQNAVKRIEGNAQLLADYADTLALLRGRKFVGEPYALIKRALTIDPRNVKALALAGTAELDAGNPVGAIEHWEKALVRLPTDAPFAQSLFGSIAQARRQLGTASPTVSAASVSGTVSVSPRLAAQVRASDTVFVFARAEDGPRMPLAILKRSAGELPLRFTLDDSLAMAGGSKLSQSKRVVVGARISKSGSAAPRSGDLDVTVGPLDVNGAPLELIIDRTVP